jgi:Lamin Tail Domain
MSSIPNKFLVSCFVLALGFISCELETEPPPAPSFRAANHPVINEVFTLPITNQNVFSWIEILNPTKDSVNLKDWTLTYNAPRGDFFSLLFKDTTRNNAGEVIVIYVGEFTTIRIDSVGSISDVPFAGVTGAILRPNEMFTLINDRDRLEVFSDVGPGPGPAPRERQLIQLAPDTIRVPVNANYSNLSVPDTVRSIGYAFFIFPTEQLILKDPNGTVVDVVRMGNYVYPGPGPDPYPGNQSMGIIPEYESICRYAGGYFTGNTANDFYVTGAGVRPIPHYYSQLIKP